MDGGARPFSPLLREIFDRMPAGVAVFDRDLCLVEWNTSFAGFLAQSRPDLAEQLKQMEKLGGMGGVLGMMPGIGKLKGQINEKGLDKDLRRQRAIISSMTPHERRNPKVLDGKRKRRIAKGSGTSPADINKLLKMHMQMADMMKSMSRGKGGMIGKMFGLGGGGAPSEAEMAKMQEELAKLDPKALEQLPAELRDAVKGGGMGGGGLPGGMPKLPGLGGLGGMPRLPGLGGPGLPKFPGFPGKKK